MINYKLISFEPTPEMVEAAEDAYMPFGDMDLAIRMAILAAPDVQGEPVATFNDHKCFDLEDANRIMRLPAGTKLYTAPQPAEQQPLKSSLALEAATHLTNWLGMDLCECEGGHTCGYTDVKRTRDALLVAAEQHPDDAAVDRFAAAMKAKLAKKRTEGRSGWQDATAAYLSHLLYEHVRKGDPVDVGNLAMMLHQNGQGIEQQPAPDMPGLTEALRQYQHNDGSGLVFGYDKLLVDRYVAQLVEALESAKNLIANHSGEVLPDEYAGDQIEQIDAALAELEKRNGK